MKIDFLTLLDESNSIKNTETQEILITSPLIEAEGEYQILNPIKISSSSNTLIKCDIIEIHSPSVSFSNLSFETNIIVDTSNDFTFQNCTIKSTKKVADSVISIVSSQNVQIDNCKITESIDCCGLSVNFESIANIKNTEISHQSDTLLVIGNGSFVTVSHCNLHHSECNGIHCSVECNIQVDHCTINDINYPPILVNSSFCEISNNIIHSCSQNGINIAKSPHFTIENNTISKISNSAISVQSESQGIIKSNKVSEIGGNGAFIEFSKVEFLENTFNQSTYPGIAVINESEATLKDNKISNVKMCGIAGRNAKTINIINNEIDSISECGISLSSTEKCLIEGNKITNCAISSVECYNKSNAVIQNNKISHMGKYAFLSYTSGSIKSENNEIDHIGDSMVKLSHKGSGEFINNKVSGCPNQCDNKTTSIYYFANNGQFEAVTNDKERAEQDSIKFEMPNVNDEVILCLKCNKNQRNCYLMKCGHKVYCKECAQLALENKENCPLCRFPIIQVSEGYKMGEEDLCFLCFENKPDAIIMPCGHTGVCSICLNNWFKNNRVCPCCRTGDCYYNKIETSL